MKTSRLQRWIADWRRAPLAGRVIVTTAALLWGAAYIYMAINMAASLTPVYTWLDAGSDAIGVMIVVTYWAVLPFRIASAAQRRGGSFTQWALSGGIFGGLLVGLIYLVKPKSRPQREQA